MLSVIAGSLDVIGFLGLGTLRLSSLVARTDSHTRQIELDHRRKSKPPDLAQGAATKRDAADQGHAGGNVIREARPFAIPPRIAPGLRHVDKGQGRA